MKIEANSAAGRTLVSLGWMLLQLWSRTIHFEIEDRGGALQVPNSVRLIAALWHNRLLLLPFVIQRFAPERQGAALISASRDGEWLTAFVERFGFKVVRGSSSRRGTLAILQLADVIAGGEDVVITPDGPRGPAYRLGDGIVFLAQKTGARVVPVNIEFESCWRLRSWDRFILPRPFSKVRVIVGTPFEVPPTQTEEGFARERDRTEAAMMALVEMR